MKRRWKSLLIVIVLVSSLLQPLSLHAEYFEHHKDWTYFCMQAKDITITDVECRQWIQENILGKKLLEKSEVFTRNFQPSNSKKPMTEYKGSYDIDDKELRTYTFREDQESVEIPVTFYIDIDDKKWNYISIVVKVEAAKQAGINAEPVKQKNSKEEHLNKLFSMTNILVALTAFVRFASSINSDYRILAKYKRMVNEELREGNINDTEY